VRPEAQDTQGEPIVEIESLIIPEIAEMHTKLIAQAQGTKAQQQL
jgi:phosphopantothenate-cysteine ligase